MRKFILLLFPLALAFGQVSIQRTATMRYNDQTGTTGRSMAADTFGCSMKSGSFYYCLGNDSFAASGSNPSGIADRNILFWKLSLDLSNVNNTVATLIDSTASYGTNSQQNTNGWTNNTTFKTRGMDFRNSGLLYATIEQQCQTTTGACSGVQQFTAINASIIVSDDATTASPNHWANPKTYAGAGNTVPHNGTTAAGDPPQGPTADSAIMWPGSTHMSDLFFVQYASGDTTDNNSTTCYGISRYNFVSYYLSKVACSAIMDVTAYSYYTGPAGGDVNNAANWCSTSYAACAASHTVIASANYLTGISDTAGFSHLPAPWNVYVAVGAFYDSANVYHLRHFWSPSLTGPWTPVAMDATLSTLGQGFPQFLLDTLTVTDATQHTGTISVISGGVNGGQAAGNYSPYWSTYAIGPGTFRRGYTQLGNGMLTQGNSGIRIAQGLAPNSIPGKGLQWYWGFDDQATLPTTWPYLAATEMLTKETCTASSGTSVSAVGMTFTGTGAPCVSSANAPSFFQGAGTYSIFHLVSPTTTDAVYGLSSTGIGSTLGHQATMFTSLVAGSDWAWSNYGAGPFAYTAGAQWTGGNYYVVGITANGTGTPTLYVNGRKVATTTSTGSAAVDVAVWWFGANKDGSNATVNRMLGKFVASAAYNRVLSQPEVLRLYQAWMRMAARRGITLPGNPTSADPVFSTNGGSFTNDTATNITSAGNTICYTTGDGTQAAPTAPTPGTCATGTSSASPASFTAVATGTVIKALATQSGYANSAAVTSNAFTLTAATPTASPAAGSVTNPTTVTWSTTTTGTIAFHYTTDGVTDPTCSTGTTGASVSVTTATTYKVVACKSNYAVSGVLTAAYTIGAPGGITLVSSAAASAPTASSAATTSAIDTTGANLIVVYRASDVAVTAFSDSKGNTWTALTVHGAVGPGSSKMFYCLNPTVGTGHTFTSAANTSTAQAIAVAAFSGVKVSGAFDTDTGNASVAPATTVQPGAITPAIGELLVAGVGWAVSGGGTVSIDSGFTITNQLPFVAGTSYGVGLAYLVASSAVSTNPTYTASGASLAGMSSSMAGFLKQ